MKIRSYHSDTVESAIRQARLELGEEAMLLDSAQSLPSEQHMGRYKVRFAISGDGSKQSAATPGPEACGQSAAVPLPALCEISEGIEQIREMLCGFTQTCYLPASELLGRPQLARVHQGLAASEVSPQLSAQLVAGLAELAGGTATRAEIEQALIEQLEALIPVSPGAGAQAGQPAALALVGPTGVGKTTTLAKLAVQCGLRRGRRVHFLSMDSHRVAAVSQIETYAGILGADCTAVDGVGELASALDRLRQPEALPQNPPGLILIDTPGFGFAELGRSAELAQFLSARPDIDTHLVVSASTKPKDLHRTVESYRPFGPRKLLFTKLDETLSFGPLVNEAVRTRWPLSFLAAGQSVPEDLIGATKAIVARLIVHRDLAAVLQGRRECG
jgi:flagellar biosynthesis protein FlhF